MTLCVAIQVPSDALNPERRLIDFPEPGIVIATDSRYLWRRADPQIQDDGMKLCPLSDRSLAAFSGNVRLATSALISVAEAITSNAFKDAELIARATQRFLLHFRDRLRSHGEVGETSVLLGTCDVQSDQPFLYSLSSEDGFNPAQWDEICLTGSGASGFQATFESEAVHFARQWSDPAWRYKLVDREGLSVVEPMSDDELIGVPIIQVAVLLAASMDRHLEIADLDSIGGLVQCAILTAKGLVRVRGLKSDDEGDQWVDLTVKAVRNYFQATETNPDIARMSEDLTIQD